MANKHDGVWVELDKCFLSTPGLVLPVGTMLCASKPNASPAYSLCTDQRWRCLLGDEYTLKAPLDWAGDEGMLLLPTTLERLTVAEAREKMKPRPARGIQVGDCLKRDDTDCIWTRKANLLWVPIPYPGHTSSGNVLANGRQEILNIFGPCKVAPWKDALRWLLEEAEHD